MKIVGYSERGLVYSLFFALGTRPDGREIVAELLAKSRWPFISSPPQFDVCEAILVEQSFSDFGDADAVLLCGDPDSGQVVFLEAKRGDFSLEKEWKKFSEQCGKDEKYPGMTSSLFSQLYFKQRLSKAADDCGVVAINDLQGGIELPSPLGRVRNGNRRKIGDNGVVLNAVRKIGSRFRNPYFLAVVPQTIDEAVGFWPRIADPPLDDWNPRNWGALSIGDVDRLCRERNLECVVATLDANQEQLFGKPRKAKS